MRKSRLILRVLILNHWFTCKKCISMCVPWLLREKDRWSKSWQDSSVVCTAPLLGSRSIEDSEPLKCTPSDISHRILFINFVLMHVANSCRRYTSCLFTRHFSRCARGTSIITMLSGGYLPAHHWVLLRVFSGFQAYVAVCINHSFNSASTATLYYLERPL
jgi:hypothetical protein